MILTDKLKIGFDDSELWTAPFQMIWITFRFILKVYGGKLVITGGATLFGGRLMNRSARAIKTLA
ncbi:MAG: hypothetical protein SV686_02480 [Thermodesulfobacteriota bacterium]|nr:hypothetical protein [Thermodesulfobacteriota bacterium]